MPDFISSQVKEKIMRNYTGGDLSCKDLLALLEFKVQSRALRARNELASRMAQHRHRNIAAHKSTDKTMHYTIFINDKGHHVRLDNKGYVFQITDANQGDLGSVPPWVPPGGR